MGIYAIPIPSFIIRGMPIPVPIPCQFGDSLVKIRFGDMFITGYGVFAIPNCTSPYAFNVRLAYNTTTVMYLHYHQATENHVDFHHITWHNKIFPISDSMNCLSLYSHIHKVLGLRDALYNEKKVKELFDNKTHESLQRNLMGHLWQQQQK